MNRNPFDPVSLVFGLVFVIAGIYAVSGGSIVDDAAWLLPVGLIGLGLALMLGIRATATSSAARKRRQGLN